MNSKYLFFGLLVVAFGAGCTQQKTAQSNKDRVYYHDRRVTVGSNIPRSYSDGASANAPQSGMTAADQMQLNQVQQSTGAVSGGAGGR